MFAHQSRSLDFGYGTDNRIQAVLKTHSMAEIFRIPCELRCLFDGWELCYPSIDRCIISITEIGSILRKHGDVVEMMDEHEHIRIMTADDAAGYLYTYHRYKRMDYERSDPT